MSLRWIPGRKKCHLQISHFEPHASQPKELLFSFASTSSALLSKHFEEQKMKPLTRPTPILPLSKLDILFSCNSVWASTSNSEFSKNISYPATLLHSGKVLELLTHITPQKNNFSTRGITYNILASLNKKKPSWPH